MLELVMRRLPQSAKTMYAAKGEPSFSMAFSFPNSPSKHPVLSPLLALSHKPLSETIFLVQEWLVISGLSSYTIYYQRDGRQVRPHLGAEDRLLFPEAWCCSTRRKWKYLTVNQAGRGDTFTTFMKIRWVKAGRKPRHTWNVEKMVHIITCPFVGTITNWSIFLNKILKVWAMKNLCLTNKNRGLIHKVFCRCLNWHKIRYHCIFSSWILTLTSICFCTYTMKDTM